MLKVGITGQSGFIGQHLYNHLGLYPAEFERIQFERGFFSTTETLDAFVRQCDVIVHLAAVNRDPDPEFIYSTNLELTTRLRDALVRTGSRARVIFSSSTQEERNNEYGRAKKESRELLTHWATTAGARFTGLIIPNVFGPFGKPFYNSVVATFCHQLTHEEKPQIEVDGNLQLIYVGELADQILTVIREEHNGTIRVPETKEINVSTILDLLLEFKARYFEKGISPRLDQTFERDLFNTFRSYINHAVYFPVKYQQHRDARGSFVELIRLEQGGQVSFSTTFPGITRGNHFHTRKIERFAVIRGKALIQLRKIGTDEIIEFYLDGAEPAYVDMPAWYTHNIKNIGTVELYTNFWINEVYDPADPDTYFETV